jgi:hypothetical protein
MKSPKPWSKSISKVIDDYYGGCHLEIPRKETHKIHMNEAHIEISKTFSLSTKKLRNKKKSFQRDF